MNLYFQLPTFVIVCVRMLLQTLSGCPVGDVSYSLQPTTGSNITVNGLLSIALQFHASTARFMQKHSAHRHSVTQVVPATHTSGILE